MAESSKESHGSKLAVLPITMMIVIKPFARRLLHYNTLFAMVTLSETDQFSVL
jgi:hypothetical protein